LRPDAVPSFIVAGNIGEAGGELELSDEEAHYVARVCRAESGASLHATDGNGALARLTLIEVRPRVRARIEGVERESRARAATVWCGAPEGSRADWLVEKLGELGVAVLQPIDTRRAAWRLAPARLERWHRLAIAALRQSRQRWLMRIEPPRALAEVLALAPAVPRWLADPTGETALRPAGRGETLGAIGPAEGFLEAERTELIASGFVPMSLGASRLRAETAAIAWAAWWARG
jgi:16S rRNA (uracil1498-N3)-methyltransferase